MGEEGVSIKIHLYPNTNQTPCRAWSPPGAANQQTKQPSVGHEAGPQQHLSCKHHFSCVHLLRPVYRYRLSVKSGHKSHPGWIVTWFEKTVSQPGAVKAPSTKPQIKEKVRAIIGCFMSPPDFFFWNNFWHIQTISTKVNYNHLHLSSAFICL